MIKNVLGSRNYHEIQNTYLNNQPKNAVELIVEALINPQIATFITVHV